MKKIAKKGNKAALTIGAGVLTAAALAAAGAYLLSDKKQMKKAKDWAVKARKDIAKNVRATRKLSEVEYARIVDKAVKHYATLHKVAAPELRKTAADMKAEWKRLMKDAQVVAKTMKPVAKKKASKKPVR